MGPQTYTRHSKPRRKPETELVRIWRVVRYAPGHPDSPSPALHCHAPSIPPPSPMKVKCMSGANNSCQSLDSMAT
eukprot:1147077-Pelagomonas_calceolata.AAC.2